MDENIEGDVVFEQCQIGKGLKPLAQHGSIVISKAGMITLVGTSGDVIDTAPLRESTAKRIWITGGQTVSLTLAGRKYNATPGWGNRARQAMGSFTGMKAPKALVRMVQESGGA
jgi:hypothetical protein